ncbi:polysaccharide pyruvyl transferase family protein [Synergistaceae bacterium OttesenSCG-928-D05]|nr:polysaccharide pyruvyl transferase family protein [Synergistaceae bacterium OttesenSCG-928-D05]
MRQKKFFFPLHLGSDNRGCEGIIRGVLNIMNRPPQNVILIARDEMNLQKDRLFLLDKLATLYRLDGDGYPSRVIYFLLRIFRKIGIFKERATIYPYVKILREVQADDVVFMTGGDLYCYKGTLLTNKVINKFSKKSGAKTVLLGCSLDESLLSAKVLDDLRRYDLIVCRESLSFDMLNGRGFSNIRLIPDPAFSLKQETCELPKIFSSGDVVGINISNFTNQGFRNDTLFMSNIYVLIDYIINDLGMKVLLLPHVFWEEQNDFILLNLVKQKYADDERISVCNGAQYNYCQLRYLIANCRFFVGSRTHAMISAYSVAVPALALGYSVKAVGIAKDIGLDDYLVLDSKHLNTDYDILNSFKKMLMNEPRIMEIYKNTIDSYTESAFLLSKILCDFLS